MAILNFGSIIIDHVYRVPHFVRPGETLPATDYRVFAGGKGFNQTLAMARAGMPVTHAGAIGENGRWLLGLLAREGVEVADVAVTDTPTGHGVIQVTADGENAILQYPGANRTLTRAHIDRILARFGAGDVLVLQNEVNEIDYLVHAGHARGMRIVLNPAPMDAAIGALPLDAVGLLVVNEIEAADLTDASSPEAMLTGLRAQAPHTAVVLTLGTRGAIYQDASQRIETPAWPVTAVDTTGAGDTFTGYLVASLLQGLPVERAMARAARAAALCVTRPGAADAIPRAAEVDALG
jgi:ribokinase